MISEEYSGPESSDTPWAGSEAIAITDCSHDSFPFQTPTDAFGIDPFLTLGSAIKRGRCRPSPREKVAGTAG